jgi:AsmA-like C-terminal region
MTNLPATSTARVSPSLRRRRMVWILCLAVTVVVLGAAGGYCIDRYWPFRYRNVEPLLENVFASHIKIEHYHRTYFPSPGFVASEITLRRNSAPDLPPVGSVRSLVVEGSWIDLLLFRKRVSLVDVKGLHVVIPPVGSRANREDFPPGSSADFSGPSTFVEELRIHDSILDIMRTNGSRYSYPIRQLIVRNLQKGHTITYSVDMQNAEPAGHLRASGTFGPLIPKNLGATPLSGDFTFSPVNLHDFGGISGVLSAAGHFQGALSAIEGYATADTPDFAVGNGKRTAILGSVQCTVNGLNSNLVLHRIDIRVGASTIYVQGEIMGRPKVTNLDLIVTRGRPQDLLRPFFHDEVPVVGVASLDSHARIGPAVNGAKFLQRLQMDASFDIPAERLTDKPMEQKLSDFSKRAQGNKSSKSDQVPGDQASDPPPFVLSSLKGKAKLRGGIVSTQRLSFQVPGAAADLSGDYNLRDKSVHLLGELRMDSDISHITTGIKSLLLKPLIPFFKRENAGAVIPIAIIGYPNHYKITQNLLHNK